MQEASLPSPDIGAKGYHLRRMAANVISQLEIVAMSYPNGAAPGASKVVAFFNACSAKVTSNGLTWQGSPLTYQGNTLTWSN